MSFLRDLRFAARSLGRTPGFAAVAVLTIAIGIGVTTAIFAVVDAVLFAPLGLAGEERLVRLRDFLTAPDGGRQLSNTSGRSFDAIRENNRVFEMVVAWNAGSRTIPDRDGQGPERISVVGISQSLSETVGVRPRLGRDFTSSEEAAGLQARVVLISSSLWHRRLGGEATVLGSALVLDGVPFTIVGILPTGFRFPYDAEAWVPQRIAPRDEPAVFARLKPGVTLAAARRDLARIAVRLKEQDLSIGRGFGMDALPARESLIADEHRIAVALMAVVGFFFLLACADVANLLLARALSRWRETAIRTALGASRSRQVTGALAEAWVLVLPGAAAGIVLSSWTQPLLSVLIPDNLRNQLGLSADRPNTHVLAFSVGLAILAAVACAIVPAWRISSRGIERMLREAGRSAERGRQKNRLLGALVVSELAFSLVLLTGAGLFVTHLSQLRRRDLGFEPRNLLTLRVALPPARYGTGPRRADAVSSILQAVEQTPGVATAGVTTVNPLAGGTWVTPLEAEGIIPPDRNSSFLANFRMVSPGLFRTMAVPILAGREFENVDREGTPAVAIVSRALARHLWPRESAIGKRLRFGGGSSENPWRIVVGVAGDVADAGQVRETWYLPYAQMARNDAANEVHVMVRGRGQPRGFLRQVRIAIASVDPELAAFGASTMEALRKETLSRERFGAGLASTAAAVGVLLAALGVGSVGSYRIQQRRREIAIRTAIGAHRGQLLAGLLEEGLRLVVAGLVLGAAGAFFLDRLVRATVPDLASPRWTLLVGLGLLLGGIALLALTVPAIRASRRDPMEVLRV